MRSVLRSARGALLFALVGCADPSDAPEDFEAPGTMPEIRPDTPGNNLQFNFDAGDLVEAYGSPGGQFLIHFTRSGPNAVPAADTDMSGIPDFVEQVASVYDEVLDYYTNTLGFRAPRDDGAIADNGGDARFDVYLVDFAGVGDGNFAQDGCASQKCAGYMIQENDYAGYGYPSTLVANRILGSHEFFHAVQAAYDTEQGSVLAEGTAVWATEAFDPSLDDFEAFVDAYLENPDRPIDEPLPGPADPFSYGSAIFFQFLSEAYGTDIIRALWESCENGAEGVADPIWIEALGSVLQANASTTFADAFAEFAKWNLFTSAWADPDQSYDGGVLYADVRLDTVTAPHQDDALRVYHASAQYFDVDPAGRASMTAALVAPESSPDATTDIRLMLATETGNTRAVTLVDDLAAGTQVVDTTGVERLIVVVVNTAIGGDSKKPGLCIGTPDEVATCKQALGGQTGEGGAGGGQEGGAGGSGGGDGDPDDDEAEDDGCSCKAAGQPDGGLGVGSLAALAAIGLSRQTRRRRRAATNVASAR